MTVQSYCKISAHIYVHTLVWSLSRSSHLVILFRTLARLPLTSQALTGTPAPPSPSTTSTLRATMSTCLPSGQWAMSSRTMTGGRKLPFIPHNPSPLIVWRVWRWRLIQASVSASRIQTGCFLTFSNFHRIRFPCQRHSESTGLQFYSFILADAVVRYYYSNTCVFFYSTKMFPVFGFGAQLPSTSQVLKYSRSHHSH